MAELTKAMKRVLRAREVVASRNVFFSSVIYQMRLVENNDIAKDPMGNPTMCTNGRTIFFSSVFVNDKKNKDCIEGVLLHEVLHGALRHITRYGDRRNFMLWQICADFAINPPVSQIFKLPEGALFPPPELTGKTVEEMYEYLMKFAKDNNGFTLGKDKGGKGTTLGKIPQMPNSGGFIIDLTPEQEEAANREWDRTLQVATERAKKAGTMPGNILRLVEELLPHTYLDWHELMDTMVRDAKHDVNSSWNRMNRRMQGMGYNFPGPGENKVLRMALVMDTSGSINEEMLREMKTEGASMLEQQLASDVVMISTDTRVCSEANVTSALDVQNFDLGRCGGGTDFRNVMARIKEIPDLAGVVFFTDMMTCSFGEDPGIPVVWVNWTDSGAVAPYGQTTKHRSNGA